MIGRAQNRSIYSILLKADAVTALQGMGSNPVGPPAPGLDEDEGFGVVAAADVLVYMGTEVADIFQGVARVLDPETGIFVFTVETMASGDQSTGAAPRPPAMDKSGRFLHSDGWIRRELSNAGLRVVRYDDSIKGRLQNSEHGEHVSMALYAAVRGDLQKGSQRTEL